MRLWHYKIIPYMGTQYILGQWRECLAISGMYASEKGINHATINRVKDYDVSHLVAYCSLVIDSFKERDFTIGTNAMEKLENDLDYSNRMKDLKIEKKGNGDVYVNDELLFKDYHNDRHLKQTLYMFQEKQDVGMLKPGEWEKMQSKFKDIIEE